MSPETPDDTRNSDSSSLADPKDFNRDPCDFPIGLKKRMFPDVYPQYQDHSTPSKRLRSSWNSSPRSFAPSHKLFFCMTNK